jgi:transcriptional regulator with XRE-family HTH domain
LVLWGKPLVAAKNSLATAIRTVRKARGLSQEAFSDVSSRTYMSSLERDLKSPTLHKLTELCEVMEVHPLTLLTLAYAGDSPHKADQLLAQVRQELEAILKKRDAP